MYIVFIEVKKNYHYCKGLSIRIVKLSNNNNEWNTKINPQWAGMRWVRMLVLVSQLSWSLGPGARLHPRGAPVWLIRPVFSEVLHNKTWFTRVSWKTVCDCASACVDLRSSLIVDQHCLGTHFSSETRFLLVILLWKTILHFAFCTHIGFTAHQLNPIPKLTLYSVCLWLWSYMRI